MRSPLHDSPGTAPSPEVGSVIYVFSICAYGGGVIASCRVTCTEEFADGFERGVSMHVDEEAYYIVREAIGEADVDGKSAVIEPWTKAA